MRRIAFGALLCVAAAAPARAQPQTLTGMRHEPRTHDGLYVRGLAGPAYLDGGEVSGFGVGLGLATGVAMRENLILFVEGRGAVARDGDTVAIEAGFGLGLALYFMPVDLYVSAALAATRLTVREGEEERDTPWGPGLSVVCGKEWWVGDDWGLGVAVQVSHDWLADEAGTTVVTLALSATFN